MKLLSTLTVFFFILFQIPLSGQGNVGIGTTTPNQSAILDLTNAQQKGLLIPSMTTAQKNAMVSPANGLMIYQTDSTKGFYFFDNVHWRRIGEGGNAWIETDSAVYTLKRVGIGTLYPNNKFETHGNLLVTAPTMTTNTPPTMAQTKTMVQPSISYGTIDSTGRFYDPGGPNGNYIPAPGGPNANSVNYFCNIPLTASTGIEFIIESIGLGTGDSLIVKPSSTGPVLLALGNNNSSPGRHVFNSSSLYIQFKVNGDASVGIGFSILFKKLYPEMAQPPVSNYSGNSFYFDTHNGSLRAGQMPGQSPGNFSVALGFNNTASGDNSFSFGESSDATGENAIACGHLCHAQGTQSTAMGYGTLATGITSLALGSVTEANGNYAMSTGKSTEANGDYSMAMGENSLALGDHSIAAGSGSTANGIISTAIGDHTAANEEKSLALGSNTVANGIASTAMGNNTTANGNTSTAMGYGTEANGVRSSSFGGFTQSNGYAGTAFGIYNDPVVTPQSAITSTTPLFIIGNGDDNNARNNAMIVRKDGHVGIGTNNPRANLHVTNGSDASYDNDSGYEILGTVGSANLVLDNNEIMTRDNGTASDLFIQHDGGKVLIGAGATDHLFDVNGTVGKPGGGTWASYSDQRLKQDVLPYTDGLNEALKINPVKYRYNLLSGYNTNTEYVGVIAQQLKEVAPYMVATSEKVLADGSSGYMEVDNSAMIYMLINAVKELHADNESMKEEITLLKKGLDAWSMKK